MVKRVSLQVHPQTPCGALTGIDVEVARSSNRSGVRKIGLRYVATGNVRALRLPYHVMSGAGRADGLWERSCFEAFVRVGSTGSYHEFNLAPSGQWQCYRLDDYRTGTKPEHHVGKPEIQTYLRQEPMPEDQREGLVEAGMDPYDRFDTPFFMLTATLDLSGSLLPIEEPWELGLAAVIEERNGKKSYWALNHPEGEPDFHHPDCFALRLPAARPA